MEEQRANGADISDDTINAFKTGLMGPMAGIGDSIIQGVVIPIIVALGISLSIAGNVFGSVLVLVGLPIILMLIAHSSWMYGYKLGSTAITSILSGGKMKKYIGAASILGCMVMEGLTAGYGFDGIAVSLLGGNGGIGIFFSSILFGALRVGGNAIQMFTSLPVAVIYILQALVILFVVIDVFKVKRRK